MVLLPRVALPDLMPCVAQKRFDACPLSGLSDAVACSFVVFGELTAGSEGK